MKHVFLYSTKDDYSSQRFGPLFMTVETQNVKVGSLKPSAIQVGSNVDEVLSNLENKIMEVRAKFQNWNPDFSRNFKIQHYLTSDKSKVTLTSSGAVYNIVVNSEPNTISLLKIAGSGATWTTGTAVPEIRQLQYLNITNNSSTDASFDEVKFIVYDKYTKTIKSINNVKQAINPQSEMQLRVRVAIQGPKLSNITSTTIAADVSNNLGGHIRIADPEIGNLTCYIQDTVNYYTPFTNYGASLGLVTWEYDAGMTAINEYSLPSVEFEHWDVSTQIAPAIYSRI